MSKNTHTGKCHCGNISFRLFSEIDISAISPRECDCDFCQKHGCMAVSDPNGSVEVAIKNSNDLSIYKQGSHQADIYVCKQCGVIVLISCQNEDNLYAALNARSFDRFPEFDQPVVVSPKKLGDVEKKNRWLSLWIPNVDINYKNV